MNNINYRADIDGLRAIAVLSVLFTHLGIELFSGGYVGVDIFFVISGYLITSIIYKEISTDKFSIINFYERRIKRILPALFIVLIFTSIVGYLIFIPDDYKNYGQSLAATSLFSSNILFWMESGYFDTTSKLKPLLHTWSLGVEEQFYIFFPLLLVFLYKVMRVRLKIIIILILLFSFIYSCYGAYYNPSSTFYLLHTRAWELLLGSILALNIIPKQKNYSINNVLAILGIVLIFISLITFDDKTTFPGFNALFPTLGAFLIIYSGGKTNIISNILSVKKFVFVGLISYSLYLWHWPIIVFYKYYINADLNISDTILIIILSFIFAYLSWKYIETPFRRIKLNSYILFFITFVFLSLFISFGYFLHKTKGYPDRLDNSVQELVLKNEQASNDFMYPIKCDNFRNNPSSYDDINKCIVNSSNEKSKNIFVWGDSHIEMYFPVFKDLANSLNRNFTIVTSGGCLPVRNFNPIEKGYFCNKFNEIVFQNLLKKNYDHIIIGSKWDYYGNALNGTSPHGLAILDLIKKFEEDLIKLKSISKKITIILPTHRYEISPAIQIQKKLIFNKDSNNNIIQITKNMNLIKENLMNLAKRLDINYIDPLETYCKNSECIYQIDNISIFKDDDHLNTTGAKILKNQFIGILQ